MLYISGYMSEGVCGGWRNWSSKKINVFYLCIACLEGVYSMYVATGLFHSY